MYGIANLLVKNARFFPERMAVADVNAELTYRELNEHVNKIANYFQETGLTKGHRVGFVCDNCIQFAELWLATQKIGVVAVFLNFRATRAELSRDVRRSHCEALFYSPKWKDIISRRDLVGSDVKHLISFGDGSIDGHIGLEYIYENVPADEPEVEISETDWSTILFTSGSTGLSKGVVRTHRMIFEYAMQMAAEHEFYKTDRVSILSHSPLFHTGGLSMLMKALALCGSYVGINGIEADTIGSLIEKYSITQLFFVPPVNIMRLAASETFGKYDTSSVNFIWATGGKLSLEYVLAMIELFPGVRIKTSYGGTEFCAACSISFRMTADEVRADPGFLESAGYIGQFADVRLVDDEGRDVAPGEMGEVWVKAPFVMLEYLDSPEDTAEVFENGWYKTGDVFSMDEKGLMYFSDRKSAMIKTGGENVYPNEVESVLRKHPHIVDCAVVAQPDPKWTEAVAAAIVPDSPDIDLLDVIEFAKNNLAGYRKPQYYCVVEDLPRTASAKIDRRALLDKSKYTFRNLKSITEGNQ